MMPHQEARVEEAAVPKGYLAVPLQGLKLARIPKNQVLVILGALLVAGTIVGGISLLSANGDFGLLQQRLFGQAHLSTGTYSARSVEELNRLSWDNGLAILENLDSMNAALTRLEAMRSQKATSGFEAAQVKTQLDRSRKALRELLNDRNTLLKVSRVLRAASLFTPEYRAYLSETMMRYRTFHTQPVSAAADDSKKVLAKGAS